MQGFHINRYDELAFGKHDFPIAQGKTETVEGRYFKVIYYANSGITQPSGLQITRNYVNAAKALGGKGVISVVSNVAPELVHNCCQAFFDRDTAKACALQLEMLPLEEALFCEVNPIPVKYAMNVLGWNAGECRLPLVEPSDAHKAKIEQALLAAGLIKE